MSDTKHCDCHPDPANNIVVPVSSLILPTHGMGLSIDPATLPKPDALSPGPDDTHLVTRDGELAWEPISGGGIPGDYQEVINLYVATTGDDDNDGLTESTPFQTIQKAREICQRSQGDKIIINVGPGRYEGQIDFVKCRAQSIRITGQPDQRPVLDGSFRGCFNQCLFVENIDFEKNKFNGYLVASQWNSYMNVKSCNFKIVNEPATSSCIISCLYNSYLEINDDCSFENVSSDSTGYPFISSFNSSILMYGPSSINGKYEIIYNANENSTITLVDDSGVKHKGNAQGSKYKLSHNSQLISKSGDESLLVGSAAGTADNFSRFGKTQLYYV